MKQILLSLACLLAASCIYANTFTVSNDPNSPGQYTSLQLAINNAVPNDSIFVSGSFTSYGAVTVTKKLTLIGQGYAPIKDVAARTWLSSITIASDGLGSDGSGTVITGFYIETFVNDQPGNNNITIYRNELAGTSYIYGSGCNIFNNKIRGLDIGGNNCVLRNNLIIDNITATNNQPVNLLIINNSFACISGNSVLANSPKGNAIINNNIFYCKRTEPNTVGYFLFGAVYNCTINNNLVFNTTNTNPLGLGSNNNSGTGNLINVDPKYVSYDLNFPYFTSTDNLQLQASSPAKNAGLNGEDIGAYGGTGPIQYPLTGEPPIPQVKTMNIKNPVAAPGATLNVQLKANANN